MLGQCEMGYRRWEEAREALRLASQLVTDSQHKLAEIAGIVIPADTPSIVAGAILRNALYKDLFHPRPREINVDLLEIMQELTKKAKVKVRPIPKNNDEVVAWISFVNLITRLDNLKKLKLNAGDIVTLNFGELAEVSSVDGDGKVYFKGGRGFSAWPDQIASVAAKSDDSSARAASIRKDAENIAAKRAMSPAWSAAKSEDLDEFAVAKIATEDEIGELEQCIATAEDERPIQKLIEERPYLLTSILAGREKFCIPQKRLGSQFIPDFIIGDVNSLGVCWYLIELETPQSGLYLKDGKTFDKYTRKGLSQITEWRSWLEDNISYAQKPIVKDGLGLANISNQTDAILLVGRRSKIPVTKDAARKELKAKQNVLVHSYDWLIDSLYGALNHGGAPAFNPFLLKRSDDD